MSLSTLTGTKKNPGVSIVINKKSRKPLNKMWKKEITGCLSNMGHIKKNKQSYITNSNLIKRTMKRLIYLLTFLFFAVGLNAQPWINILTEEQKDSKEGLTLFEVQKSFDEY